MQDLRKALSPEGMKRLSMHSMNKALDRYLQVNVEDLREGYALTKAHQTSTIHSLTASNTGATPKKESQPL
jgi:hypothetical protein